MRPTVDIEVEETPTVPAIPTVLPDLRFTTGPMLSPLGNELTVLCDKRLRNICIMYIAKQCDCTISIHIF